MGPIIQEYRKPSFGQTFAKGLSEGMNKFQEFEQLKKQKQLQMQAAQKMGINPEVFNLPEKAQAEYFKNQFHQEKPLNDLQKAQQKYYDAKTADIDSTNSLFNQQFQGQPANDDQNQPFSDQSSISADEKPRSLADYSDEELMQFAAFDKQPGKKGVVGTAAKNVLDKKSQNQKQVQHEKEFFHKETETLDKELSDQSKAAEAKNRALDRQLKDVDKIGWFDRAVSSIFGNSPWGDLLRSSTAQEFDSNTLAQMQGQRQLLGGILSDSDIRLLMQKIVTASKNPQANKAIAANMKLENDLTIARKKIADEVKKENGGYRPANYENEIDNRYLEQYGNKIAENFKEIMSLPDDPQKLGEIYRRKVHPGTPLNDNIIENYYKIAKGDPELATKLAKEDGYDVPE